MVAPYAARPHATAIAIQGERITQVGDDDAVLATRAESTKIVDLKGMTVLPGLIDSHGHVRNFGRLQEMVRECGSLGFIWGIVQ